METRSQILGAARELIAERGYNGFSYRDIAERVGIRNASIHHHFPAKSDLAVALVREAREQIEAHARELAAAGVGPLEQIEGYTGYWKRCLTENSAAFCIAGMLATELPTLPTVLADEVNAHFVTLVNWFARALDAMGKPRDEAKQLVATVYGAMVSARAMRDPNLFGDVVDRALARI